MSLRTENPLAYISWQSMKRRCDDSSYEEWSRYGGRGIRYVKRWRLFENFVADMGERPSKNYSLERRNVNGHYGPHNCIWIPKVEQAINRRKAYWAMSGWQIGSLSRLFPCLGKTERPFMAKNRRTLAINSDFLHQAGKWAAKGY